MNKLFVKCFLLAICFSMATSIADAQAKKRTAKKRTTAKRTTNTRSNANINPTQVDTVPIAAKIDSLPIQTVKKSLRYDGAVERNIMKERTPLVYEHIREDDAVYRERLWREIDIREKQNLPLDMQQMMTTEINALFLSYLKQYRMALIMVA